MPLDYEQEEVIESYSDHSFAEAAISLLSSEGIEAHIHADDAGGELPNLGFAKTSTGADGKISVVWRTEYFSKKRPDRITF